MTRRFFDKLDLSLPDDELAERFEQAVIEASHSTDDPDEEVELPPEDIEAIRQCAYSGKPKSRKEAVGLLTALGPCNWQDLGTWFLDPDEDVRQEAICNSSWGSAESVCAADKARCVSLLSKAAAQYEDYAAASALQDLVERDKEWLELTWEAVESLWNSGGAERRVMITVCYYEHVIPDLGWGRDDPHIRPWIEGGNRQRKIALLAVAMSEDSMTEIVRILASGPDADVATLAKGVMDGTTRYDDLWKGFVE